MVPVNYSILMHVDYPCHDLFKNICCLLLTEAILLLDFVKQVATFTQFRNQMKMGIVDEILV